MSASAINQLNCNSPLLTLSPSFYPNNFISSVMNNLDGVPEKSKNTEKEKFSRRRACNYHRTEECSLLGLFGAATNIEK